ncbi:MAG TPA: hypothetical protein VE621_16700 [Bryobacteraceae bacterium]|nr:hypothetical protein [Bryobacteraceae bacterium]
MSRLSKKPAIWLVLLSLLVVVVYAPFIGMAYISDDYVQIQRAREFAPVEGWAQLLADPLYRCRTTSLFLTYYTEKLLGLSPFVLNAQSLLLHIVNTWLVYALGAWRIIGYRVSSAAAFFFAVYETHQEAIIWYAAIPELLQLFFALLSLLFLIHYVQKRPRSSGLYMASLVCFVLALLSKESAVAVAPLAALVLWTNGELRRRFVLLLPYAILAGIYTLLAFLTPQKHIHLHDAGTFSLHAPFYAVLARSTIRELWVWGLFALIAILLFGRRRHLYQLATVVCWIVVALLPYSFLTYMSRVPSRHLYFASVGAALLFAIALTSVPKSIRAQRVALVIALVFLFQNTIYLWTRKREQFLERAAVTERLVNEAQRKGSPIRISCFPYGAEIAELAVQIQLSKKVSVALRPSSSDGLNLCTESQFASDPNSPQIVLNW